MGTLLGYALRDAGELGYVLQRESRPAHHLDLVGYSMDASIRSPESDNPTRAENLTISQRCISDSVLRRYQVPGGTSTTRCTGAPGRNGFGSPRTQASCPLR